MTDNGTVISLFVATERHGAMLELPAVQAKAGRGIVGDRFFSRSSRHPERQVTLIESEAIESASLELGKPIPLSGPRRNIVTADIRLNELVGRVFHLGPVKLRGIELCEPCIVLGRNLEDVDLRREQIIRAFVGKGGLRAEILTDGVIRQGDIIKLTD